MRLYRVVASVARDTGNGWTSTAQVPTFYLDGEQLGLLTCADAVVFARGMLEVLAGECSRAFVDVVEG